MKRLIMRRGPTPGVIYELTDDEVTLGRGSKNRIIIHDNEVSRDHCKLIRANEDYDLEDVGSVNGTFVNGLRVTGIRPLQTGALIELGDTITLEYERLNVSLADSETPDLTPQFRYFLTMTAGGAVGLVYPLDDVIVTMGRESSNDIVIPDREVSRYHLRLRRERDGFSVEDMGSTNGTLLNDTPISTDAPAALRDGDSLRLGSMIRLTFTRQPIEETPPVYAQPSPAQMEAMDQDETLVGALIRSSPKPIDRNAETYQPALHDHVFLAYAREDWEHVAAALTLYLQDAGLEVWVDQYLTPGSVDWRAAYEQALLECSTMVVIASPRTSNNPYVRMAARVFASMHRPIVSLMMEHAPPPTTSLNRQQTVAFDEAQPERSFMQIWMALEQARLAVQQRQRLPETSSLRD